MSTSTRIRRRCCFLTAAFVAVAGLTLGSGCQKPAPVEEWVTASPIAESDLDMLWDETLSVLRKHDFPPDRQDRVNGIIETTPATSQQWGEFWRQDVADMYSLTQSSLHTTQRKATIRFVRDDEGEWRLEVQVDIYRLSTPESQVTTASSALQSFSGVLPTTKGRLRRKSQGRHWVHLGRDEAMETRLLDRIVGWYPEPTGQDEGQGA